MRRRGAAQHIAIVSPPLSHPLPCILQLAVSVSVPTAAPDGFSEVSCFSSNRTLSAMYSPFLFSWPLHFGARQTSSYRYTAPSSSSFPSFRPSVPCCLHRFVFVSSSAASCPASRNLFSLPLTLAPRLLQTASKQPPRESTLFFS